MKNMYNKLNPFSQKHDFLCQIFQAAMKFFSSTIPEFEFQKVHSNLITQIVPCPLLQHTYLSPQWCFSDFTWQLTNLVTSLVQIRGFCDDKTQFSTIPMERKVTEGSPQNVFSKLFYQYQMSSSLHGRSRPVPFLNSLSWFNAKTQQGCSARDSCLPVLLQHPGNRELLLRLCVLFPALSPTNSIFPASVWGGTSQIFSHGATPSQYQIFHLYAAFTVGTPPLWSYQHPTTSHCLFCLLTRETQFQSHLIWVY